MTKTRQEELLTKAIDLVKMFNDEWNANHIGLFYYYFPVGTPFTRQSWMNYKCALWQEVFPLATLRRAKKYLYGPY